MALLHSPRIVTDGLVLCLDAANRKSYPGSGNSWRDLAGRNNFTLFNPSYYSYEASNNGSIKFTRTLSPVTETGGYAEFTGTGILTSQTYLHNNHTTELWAKINSSSPTLYNNTETNSALFVYRGYHSMFYYNESNLTYTIWNGTGSQVTIPALSIGLSGTDIIVGQWFHVAAVRSGNSLTSYINGRLKGANTFNTPSVNTSVTNIIRMGMAFESNQSYSWHAAANISVVKMYNRALTLAEIQQNYNALKGRYNL